VDGRIAAPPGRRAHGVGYLSIALQSPRGRLGRTSPSCRAPAVCRSFAWAFPGGTCAFGVPARAGISPSDLT